MPKIRYPQVIEEEPHELEKLEKHHRYTHLFQRVRMLRLLKSGECSNLAEAADALGYSWRQCQRWFTTYRHGGLQELLIARAQALYNISVGRHRRRSPRCGPRYEHIVISFDGICSGLDAVERGGH